MADKRFEVRFPCIRLGNGERAIIVFSKKPAGADDKLVLVTCLTADGRMVQNIPISMQAIKYASDQNPLTLVEGVASAGAVVGGGLVGSDGKPL